MGDLWNEKILGLVCSMEWQNQNICKLHIQLFCGATTKASVIVNRTRDVQWAIWGRKRCVQSRCLADALMHQYCKLASPFKQIQRKGQDKVSLYSVSVEGHCEIQPTITFKIYFWEVTRPSKFHFRRACSTCWNGCFFLFVSLVISVLSDAWSLDVPPP